MSSVGETGQLGMGPLLLRKMLNPADLTMLYAIFQHRRPNLIFTSPSRSLEDVKLWNGSSHSQINFGIDQYQTGVAIGFNLLLAPKLRQRRRCDVPCIAPTCVNNIKCMSTQAPGHASAQDVVRFSDNYYTALVANDIRWTTLGHLRVELEP